MTHKPYLIFNLNGSRYGVEANYVQEVFFLPELTPIAEAPRDLVGVVNVRGDILPVMDLDRRFGYRPREYKVTDSIIVFEWEGYHLGIIVNGVSEVQELEAEQVTNDIFYQRKIATQEHNFIAGIAKIEDGIVLLLNHQNLIQSFRSLDGLIPGAIKDNADESMGFLEKKLTTNQLVNSEVNLLSEPPVFCPHATPEERAIFRERAKNLTLATERQDFTGQIPLAVIGLNEEFFALDLEMVREFTELRKITPIPCTPPHIIGNMNLRGEIVTIVDIRGLLNLPLARTGNGLKAMVIDFEGVVAAIAVDQVFDVMYLQPSQIKPIPAAVHSANDEYLKGTAIYRDKMMLFLDMPKIFGKGELVVNEEV